MILILNIFDRAGKRLKFLVLDLANVAPVFLKEHGSLGVGHEIQRRLESVAAFVLKGWQSSIQCGVLVPD